MVQYCSVDGCPGTVHARGLCDKHYKRWQMHGDPLHLTMTEQGAPMLWLNEHISYSSEECLLWPFARNRDGYAIVFKAKAYRIMCEKRHGKPPKKSCQAAHSCGRGHLGCISPVHLRWASPKENEADRVLHGTDNSGERNGRAKLTENDVMAIRRLYADGRLQKDLASIFGCSASTISYVVTMKSWIEVKPDELERAGEAA